MNRSLVNSELSLFSYEILGLVGSGGAGAHDLLRMARHGRILDWAGESQYYVEPKRLAKLGYLEARKEPGRTRERTVYTLTDNGRRALADYARTPVTVTPLKSEPLLRLLICDLGPQELTLREDQLLALRGTPSPCPCCSWMTGMEGSWRRSTRPNKQCSCLTPGRETMGVSPRISVWLRFAPATAPSSARTARSRFARFSSQPLTSTRYRA